MSRVNPAILPPSIADTRTRSFVEAMKRAIEDINFRRLLMERVAEVPASVLPFLVREMGIEDLIEPDLPEPEVRSLLSDAFELNAMRGYVAGIQRGLRLIGMDVQVIQWYQTEPKGPPGTHIIRVFVNRKLWPNRPLLDVKVQAAIRRIVEGTKRKSQDEALRLYVTFSSGIRLAAGAAGRGRVAAEAKTVGVAPYGTLHLGVAGAAAGRAYLRAGLRPAVDTAFSSSFATLAGAVARVRLACTFQMEVA